MSEPKPRDLVDQDLLAYYRGVFRRDGDNVTDAEAEKEAQRAARKPAADEAPSQVVINGVVYNVDYSSSLLDD